MTLKDWSLISLLSSSIEQCESIELMPLTSNDEYQVNCYCEENKYLALNLLEIKPIVDLCYSCIFSKKCNNDQLNIVTRVLLSYVSECLTCWNIRRHLIQINIISIQNELQFIEKVLHLRPKSEQIFRYRRWILKQESIENISIKHELDLCHQTAELHFVNYAAWLHRRWIIEYFNVDIDEELERNRLWLNMNISDSSGFSFRMYLLSKKSFEQNLIERELKQNENLIKVYTDRESLWFYRETLMSIVFRTISTDNKEQRIADELNFINQFQTNLFITRYVKYLNFMCDLTFSTSVSV